MEKDLSSRVKPKRSAKVLGRVVRPEVVLLLVFLGQWLLLFRQATPAWDAAFYYAYARSVVFDHDLNIENDLILSYPTTSADFAAKRLDQVRTETGHVASPFAVGSSLLWLPWLWVLRAAAHVSGGGSGSLTGYEWGLVGSVALLSALFGYGAFCVAVRLAASQTSKRAAIISAVTLMFTTPLLYYQYREPLYAHATSALVTGLVVLAWWRGQSGTRGPLQGVGLGGLIGLAALVRWQHMTYLALPVISTAWWWLDRPPGERRVRWRQGLGYLALVLIGALGLFSIQLAVWRLYYGSWIVVPQGSTFVDWKAPFLTPLLFSTYRGLFTWMPITLLAVMGLLALGRRQPRLALPLVAILLLETYVNGSTRDWFGGGGFGPRRFTGELVILVVGYAGLLQVLPKKASGWISAAVGLALTWHQWILLRFALIEGIGGRNLSMHPDFHWTEVRLATFIQQVAGHLPDLFRRPIDFLVLPGSPLDSLLNRAWPHQQAIVLVGTLAAALVGMRAARWLTRRRVYWGWAAGGAAVLVVMIDVWVLLWA